MLRERLMTAEEAAHLIQDGMTIGISGFTRAGDVKAVPRALADRITKEKDTINISLWSGASVAEEVEQVLVEAGVTTRRLPYQSEKSMRSAINQGIVMYIDQHLSHTAEKIRDGHLGPVDLAIIEAVAITKEGGIVPSTSVGNSPVFAMMADKIIIEVNLNQSELLEGIHDIYIPEGRSNRSPIPLVDVNQRIGTPFISVNPEKIAGIVITDQPDHAAKLTPPDQETAQIARHLLGFFEQLVKKGQLVPSLRPLQSGIGAVSNAVLHGLQTGPFHNLQMYSEVLQDAVFELMDADRLDFASSCSITLSPERACDVLAHFHKYRDKVVLRPQEISNHPGIIRRLGVIAMNTALEADIYGNVNSSHVMGSHMMNGIGGSGDFARNAFLSIFVTKSTAKNGAISSIVPMVTHVDNTEHDVDVLITEQGLADIRGLAPRECAQVIIENCVHPAYKDLLMDYYKEALKLGGHTPHQLEKAFELHLRYKQYGHMQKAPVAGVTLQ
jgi:succinyl-CoA:acetate CoA-transferase